MQQRLHDQKNEQVQLVNNIRMADSSLQMSNSELINKEISLMQDEASFKKSKIFKAKLEMAAEKLSTVIDSSLSASSTSGSQSNISTFFDNQHLTSETLLFIVCLSWKLRKIFCQTLL